MNNNEIIKRYKKLDEFKRWKLKHNQKHSYDQQLTNKLILNNERLENELNTLKKYIDFSNPEKLKVKSIIDSGKLYKLIRKLNVELERQKNEKECFSKGLVCCDYLIFPTEENYQLMKHGLEPLPDIETNSFDIVPEERTLLVETPINNHSDLI